MPSRRIREQFLVMYELEGCQKATNFLAKYYKVGKMRIFVNDKKFKTRRKNCCAYYCENEAYFKKTGLKRRIVLHEFYHHLVKNAKKELPRKKEEREARTYAGEFLRLKQVSRVN